MPIRYVKHEDLNRPKYTKCLQNSYNANAFAYPWYLDLVCENWDVLVEDNYQTVCPIPTRRWMGLNIVRQPPFIPFLGVFSSKKLNPDKVTGFMQAIPHLSVRLMLNHFNKTTLTRGAGIHRVPVLDLILPYERIQQCYAPEAREMLTLPDKSFVLRSSRAEEYITFKRTTEPAARDKHMQLNRIINYALRYKSAGIYTVYSPMNEMTAALFLIKSNRRVFLIDAVENEEGKEHHALFRGIDHLIKTNCETNLTLELPFGNPTIVKMIAFEFQHCRQYRKGIF